MICQYCGSALNTGGTCLNPACPGTLRREEMSEKKVHYLKTWPEPFRAVVAGIKRADFRLNDRDYHVGDTLLELGNILFHDARPTNEIESTGIKKYWLSKSRIIPYKKIK